MKDFETNYKISLYPSKYHGWWRPTGNINIYVSPIWNGMKESLKDASEDEKIDEFIQDMSNVILIETICLYRGKNRLKLKNKCVPHCKVARIANYLVFPEDWEGIRDFYKEVDEVEKNENT